MLYQPPMPQNPTYTKELVSFMEMANRLYLVKFDRQVSIDVGGVMGEVIAIDWRDREGCWIEFIRVQRYEADQELGSSNYQYGCWLRVKLWNSNLKVGKWRGGLEILEVDKTLHEGGGRTESTAKARGLYDATTRKRKMLVGELRQLLASKDFDINFLSKTRMWANELEHIRVRCKLEIYFFVESEGRKGGLVLLWKEMVDVRVQNHSMHHIYSLVKGAGQYHFRFTGFYGGRCKPRVAMDDFQKGIEDLVLVDIKIDRASWLDKVPFLSMEVVRQENSDHDAILLDSLGRLFDADGYWVDGSNDMCGVAWDYFHKLFKSKANGNDEIFLGQIQRCINLEMNNVLDKRLIDKENLEAFNQMDPSNAPDIDGLLGLFYKENWDVVVKDVLQICHEILNGRRDIVGVQWTRCFRNCIAFGGLARTKDEGGRC
ncbi:hypothetical protein GOBAR_DD07010 [Gossypium barbadense]|nr:hypothetical protein GOBAR_DD07010 [Gossypium barbadense]